MKNAEQMALFSQHVKPSRETRQAIAGPNSREAQPNLERHMCYCRGGLPATCQLERLIAEGREGCKSAKYTDQQEPSNFRAEQLAALNQSHEHPDEEASDDVHREGPVWERGPLEEVLYPATDQVACDRPQESTGPNEQYQQHFGLRSQGTRSDPLTSMRHCQTRIA